MPHSLLKRLRHWLCCHRDEHRDISADRFSRESASIEIRCTICHQRRLDRLDSYSDISPIAFTRLIESGESCAMCKLLLDVAISYEPDKQSREAGVMSLLEEIPVAGTTPRSSFRLRWAAGNKSRRFRIFYLPSKLYNLRQKSCEQRR